MRCNDDFTPFDACVNVSDPAGGDIRVSTSLATKAVKILCSDGSVVSGEVLSSGVINPVGRVPDGDLKVGIPIMAEAVTLPIQSAEITAGGAARTKAVNRVWLRIKDAIRIKVESGRDSYTYTRRGDSTQWEQDVLLSSGWTEGGQIAFKHEEPGKCEVLSMSLEVAIGG